MTDDWVYRAAADLLAEDMKATLDAGYFTAPLEFNFMPDTFRVSDHYEFSAWLRWYHLFPPPGRDNLLIVSGI